MVSLGYRYYGIARKVSEDEAVKPNVIYESWGEFNQEIPEEVALSYLQEWRNRLAVEHGVFTQYMEVRGKTFVVQWYVKHTSPPIPVREIILTLIIVAGIIASIFLAREITATIKETRELASVIGPENLSMIVSIFGLFILLMFMSPFISMIAEIPKMITRAVER